MRKPMHNKAKQCPQYGIPTDRFNQAVRVNLLYDFLVYASNKNINTLYGVNQVTYDISSKPLATIIKVDKLPARVISTFN